MLANAILELGLKITTELLKNTSLTLYGEAHHNGQSVYLNLFHTSYGFQDSATATSQAIIDLHNDLMFFLVVVVVLISYLLGSAIYFHYLSTTQYYIGPRCHGPSDDDEDSDKIPHLRTSIEDADLPVIEVGKEDPIFNSPLIIRSEINHQTRPQLVTSLKNHDALLEIVWTIVPAIILIAMIAPSFALIYSLDEVVAPLITLKITGRQWYWSYDYTLKALPDEPLMALSRTISKHFIFRKRFDSIMLSTKDLFFGEHRLLEVNRKLTVPAQIPLRLLITASDVLHSWAVPAMGAKIDACPGRLNQTSLFIKREGVFYGQCSEICGIGHGFMPVVVQTADLGGFYRWFSRYFGIKFVNPQRADLIPHMRHALQRPSITDNELIEVWEKFVTKQALVFQDQGALPGLGTTNKLIRINLHPKKEFVWRGAVAKNVDELYEELRRLDMLLHGNMYKKDLPGVPFHLRHVVRIPEAYFDKQAAGFVNDPRVSQECCNTPRWEQIEAFRRELIRRAVAYNTFKRKPVYRQIFGFANTRGGKGCQLLTKDQMLGVYVDIMSLNLGIQFNSDKELNDAKELFKARIDSPTPPIVLPIFIFVVALVGLKTYC